MESKKRVEKAIEKAEKLYEANESKLSQDIRKKAALYIKDAKYFLRRGDLLSAMGAADYAYGLIEGNLSIEVVLIKDGKASLVKMRAEGLEFERADESRMMYWKHGKLYIRGCE